MPGTGRLPLPPLAAMMAVASDAAGAAATLGLAAGLILLIGASCSERLSLVGRAATLKVNAGPL